MNKDMDCNQKFPSDNVYEIQYPIIAVLDILGQKWKLPIIWYLAENDTTRYNELKRKIKGITTTMLTKSLRELEEYNIIIRTQYNTIPPKVEYSLAERGKALIPVLRGLNAWGEKYLKID